MVDTGKKAALWAAGLAVLVLLHAGVAQAQVTVTVVMNTGERHVGENPQLSEGGTFSLRIKSGGELRAKSSEVAHVDFVTTDTPAPDVVPTPHAIVLRDGTVVKGKVVDMAHVMHDDEGSDYVVRFSDEQGQARRYLANEIARVYFSPPSAVSR